jgi:hypothetical protein
MRRLLVLLLAASAGPADAATFVQTSVEAAARGSDAVVHGKVLSRTSRMTEDGRAVYTEVEIGVGSAWKGAPDEVVRVFVRGGRVGRVAQVVDGAAAFEDGEEVVVFLSRRGAAWRVTGNALGKYRVDGGMARPSLAEADVIPRALAAGERAVGAMPLDELEQRVRGAR